MSRSLFALSNIYQALVKKKKTCALGRKRHNVFEKKTREKKTILTSSAIRCVCAHTRACPAPCPCSVSTWCCVHGFQALIHVLPKKKGRCVVRVFSRRSGAKVNPYPNLNAPPGHLPMRFDERETTHPVLPELDLAVVREKKKKTPTLHL